MITVKELRKILCDYQKTCNRERIRPTKSDLSRYVGVSVTTVYNALRGMYNGTYYGDKPSNTRCFENQCFDTLRDFFDYGEE